MERLSLLQMAHIWLRLSLRRIVGLSIDITNRCPLSCTGCYMKWYPGQDDLPREHWAEIIEAFPKRQRFFCAWTGGEPLLRADDIRELSQSFAWNWVATNGTLSIPDIPRTTFFVSVDGPESIHDSLRGGWSEIRKNLRPQHYVACTVRRENSAPQILRELVAFWSSRAAGMVFGFLTPRRDDGGESLDRKEREGVLATLRELGREFGPFIVGASGQIGDCVRTSWGMRCPAKASLVTFDAGGNRKRPCTLGPEVDCARCGCAVPGFFRRVRRMHPSTLAQMMGLFS